jgi:RimJ/RimL family protein N-acetyltransferase
MNPFHFQYPVRTQRLTLRPIVAGDFDDVHAYMSRDDVAQWLPEPAYALATSRDRHANYCDRIKFAADGDLILAAIDLDGRVIGDLDLTACSFEVGLVEIGWRLHPDFQGAGYATEAARAMLTLSFGPIGARRAVAHLDVRNVGSSGVCERLGMRRKAHHIADTWMKGQWVDTLTYAALATEWDETLG